MVDGPCACPATAGRLNTKTLVGQQCGYFRRAGMATFNRERVEHALNELLVRIVPEDPNEDDETANERFEGAFNFAIDELSNAGPLPVVADINHVAGLIDRRSMGLPRDYATGLTVE